MTRQDAATEALAEALVKRHDLACPGAKTSYIAGREYRGAIERAVFNSWIDEANNVQKALNERGYVIRKARKA